MVASRKKRVLRIRNNAICNKNHYSTSRVTDHNKRCQSIIDRYVEQQEEKITRLLLFYLGKKRRYYFYYLLFGDPSINYAQVLLFVILFILLNKHQFSK